VQQTPVAILPTDLPSAEVLIEAIHNGFLLVSPEWKVVHSNRNAQQLLRRSWSELASSDLWEIIVADPNALAQQELRRAVEQQVSVEVDVFYPHLFTWHEVKATPSPQGLILVLRDITDRQWLIHREAERAYLRKLFMDAPIAISVTRGSHHQFEFINRFAEKLIGGRQVEGLMVREAFPEVVGQGLLEILDRVYETGESYQAEEVPIAIDRHGTGVVEEGFFNISYQALRSFNHAISGILSVSIEVTDQVRARTIQSC
jgi:PAS domain-containing protein